MRPIELVIKDFRSFKGEHRVSFADRRLVAIAGPIGSGKTSILDAIAYALYGRTPKLGRQAVALINQEASEMSLRLRFRVGKSGWEIERLVRRRGTGGAAIYPYSESDGRNQLDAITGVENVRQRVEEILGMDFAAFSRSVLLPQGQFAEFLQATAAEKDKVLKGVFGLERIDRMRLVARERALLSKLEADRATAELGAAEAAAAELVALEPELVRANQRAAAVGKLQTRAGQLDLDRQAAASELDRLGAAETALARAAQRLRPKAEIAALIDGAQAAASRNRAAADHVAQSRRAMESSEAGLKIFLAEHGGEDGIRAARRAVDALIAGRAKVAEASGARNRAESALEKARRAQTDLTEQLEAASRQAGERARKLERAQSQEHTAGEQVRLLERADMAKTLREAISDGDQCPVCGHVIEDLPAGHAHPDLETARATTAAAAAERQRAAGALSRARERAATLAGGLEAATAGVAAAARERTAARQGLESVADSLALAAEGAGKRLRAEDPEAALSELEIHWGRLRGRREGNASKFAAAVEEESGVRAEGRTAQTQVAALETELSGIAGQMGALEEPAAVLDHDAAVLAKRLREFARARKSELAGQRSRAQGHAAELTRQRRRLLAEWDVPGDTDVNRLATTILGEAATLSARERGLAELAHKVPALMRRRRDRERRRRHLERLAEDLRDSRFLKHMLAGKRIQLAELGGLRIRELTGGRFGFSPGDRFEVVDYGADDPELRTRSADTLSGGETFLASLSLALALADLVAGQGGRSGSFFLDEGFGSLDADHLAVAMDGIERLAAETDDRLVVVVSHVPGVQERVEDQIILGASTGTAGGSEILAGADPA